MAYGFNNDKSKYNIDLSDVVKKREIAEGVMIANSYDIAKPGTSEGVIGSVAANGTGTMTADITRDGFIPIGIARLSVTAGNSVNTKLIIGSWSIGKVNGVESLMVTVFNQSSSALSNVKVTYSLIYLNKALLNK